MADISLPAAGGGRSGPRRRRGIELPSAGDVRSISPTRDPGLSVPRIGGGEGFEAAGKGLATVGAGLDALEAQREKAEAVAYADGKAVEMEAAWLDDYLTSAEQAPEGAPGFAAGLVNRHKTRLAEALSSAPSEKARQRLQRFGESQESSVFNRARVFEHNSRAEKVVSDTEKTLDSLGLNAFREPDTAHTWRRMGDDVISNARESAGLSTSHAAKLREKFARDVTAAQVRGLIERDPTEALERLKAQEFDGDLGDADLARRLEAEASIRVRAADAEASRLVAGRVRDAVSVLDAGKIPPDLAEVQALANDVADFGGGTEFKDTLREAIEDREQVAAFVRLPGREQVAKLRALSATDVADRRTIDRTRRLERAHGNIIRALRADQGLALAAEIGVIQPLRGVDPGNPATLRARVAQAAVASEHFGTPISPLTKAETDDLAASIAGSPSEEATATLSTLRAGLGEDGAMAVAGKLAKSRPGLAMAVALVGDRPETAREILAGDRLLARNREVKPSKENILPAVRDIVGNAFEFGGDAVAPIVDAATAIYAARRVPGGDFTFDSDTFETALKDVMGGPVNLNGRTIIPPEPGMDAGKLRDVLTKLKPEDLARFGNGRPVFGDGTAFASDRFESRFIGPSAQLVTAGFGRYLVHFKGIGFVQTPDGEPYELDLGAYLKGSR